MGGKPKTHKMGYFFDLTEISGRNFGRKVRKSAECKFVAKLIPTFRGFEFEAKTKKLEGFKVRECEIFENRFYPPIENEGVKFH